jgi:hypothetical protein
VQNGNEIQLIRTDSPVSPTVSPPIHANWRNQAITLKTPGVDLVYRTWQALEHARQNCTEMKE